MRLGRPGAVLLLLLLPLPVLAGTVAGGAAPRVFSEDCGRRPLLDSAAGSPVVGGHDAQTGAWPWSVSLQIRQAGLQFTHLCGGVLVNENSVLTAGHCVRKRKYVFMRTPLFSSYEEGRAHQQSVTCGVQREISGTSKDRALVAQNRCADSNYSTPAYRYGPWEGLVWLQGPATVPFVTFAVMLVCGDGRQPGTGCKVTSLSVSIKKDPYSWRAVLGVYNLWKHGKYTAKRNIKSITVHPEFNGDTFENDIALFQLHSAVRYSDYIQPLCLPPAHLDAYLDNETACYVSGWGLTEEGKTPAMLKEAQVEIIPSSICNGSDAYRGLVKMNMICAGSQSGGTDTCQGDSGGPLACYDPSTNKYYLIGIASFGLGCGQPKFPGIYVRLSQYGRWIESELLSNKAVNPVSVTLTIFLTVVRIVLAKTF
ncbi:transmembrane protease serine 12 [Chlamydotis macqueenii]